MNDHLRSALRAIEVAVGDAVLAARRDHKTPLQNESGLVVAGEVLFSVDPSGWSVFSGDVNDFKDLNSKLGYDGADLVLHSVGSVLAELLAIGCPAFRRGGDEFVVLAPTSRVEDVVGLIRNKLSPLATRVEQTTTEVYTSFGYTSIDTDLSFRENLDRADRACKAAKWQGNGAVIQWSAEIQVGFSARLRCPSCRTQVSIAVAPERSQKLTPKCMVCGLTLPN